MPAAVLVGEPAQKPSRQPVHQRIRFLVERGIRTRIPPSGQVPSPAARAVPGATICANFQSSFFTTSELGINRTFDREPNRLRDVARWRILRKLPDSLPIIVPKTNGIAVALDRKAKHGRV